MGSNTYDLTLCECCANFRDADKVLAAEGFKHHSSYTALCKSAERGCKLCQVIVCAEAASNDRKLSPTFDQGMDVAKTQITCKCRAENCDLSMLQKDSLTVSAEPNFRAIFEIYTDWDDPLAEILRGRPIQPFSDSNICFELMSSWMNICKTEHPLCPRDEEFVLPTRLINVGSNTRDPFLHTSRGENGRWATLSHCWGTDVPAINTKASLAQRTMSISLAELPATFQDAILATKKLGLQYIWIDSLCIIQDSSEDWARESTRMHEIYSRASINIAATAARSCTEGIFSPGNTNRHLTETLFRLPSYSESLKLGGKVYIRAHTQSWPFRDITELPLHRRGWVFQESVLSPRRIDFGQEQLYWSCQTSNFKEGSPSVSLLGPEDHWKIYYERLFQMPSKIVRSKVALAGTEMNWWWYHCLNLYCRRNFTFTKDYLSALAGIAAEFQEWTGYTYRAGLWLEDIHRGLLWQATDNIQRTKDTTVPSWSWASVSFPWHHSRLNLNTYLPDSRATILKVDVRNVDDNQFGQVISGSIKMVGASKSLSEFRAGKNIVFQMSSSIGSCKNEHIFCTLDKERPSYQSLVTGKYSFDAQTEESFKKGHEKLVERRVIGLQIARFTRIVRYRHDRTETQEVALGLLLEPVDDQEDGNVYRRIGIVEIPTENGMADGWEKRTVTIV